MYWNDLVTPPVNLTAGETRELLASHSPDQIQLIDVRQPREYSQFHLPGARLIPLSELEQRLDELDPELTTVVYCRSGVRSATGAQLLRERKFSRIHNMQGGILAWRGARVQGDGEQDLGFFLKNDYSSIYALSCNLEAGLQRFYSTLAETAAAEGRDEVAATLAKMAGFEDGHIARLIAMHNRAHPDRPLEIDPSLSEGGFDPRKMITAFGANLATPQAVLELALSFEAQAFDLYSRLEHKVTDSEQAEFFHQMTREEHSHMVLLARELDNLDQKDLSP